MASPFAKSLLAAVAAIVVGGTAAAQTERFREGVKFYRLGEGEQALAAFREVLRDDPSNAEAMDLYRSISQDEWFMLLAEQGEIGKIAQSIMERARLERRERSRDETAIESLVATATAVDSEYAARRDAILKLMIEHGEFAVPTLARRLGDPDDGDGQVFAVMALVQMGPSVVLPLIELLDSSNATLRLNAAAALSQIGDRRAAPAMARLAQNDEQENVRNVAQGFLRRHGITGRPLDLYLRQARGYLQGGVGVGDFSGVVWSLENDRLVATDVPALVYPVELAKAAATDAVMTDPASSEARSVYAQANLAEANLIETSIREGDESVAELAETVPLFQLAALATGPAVLRAALEEGLQKGLPSVSVGAIGALARVEERGQLASSSLVAALDSTDKRVRYAAAVALVEASRGVDVPATEKVVDALAQAVTEEAVKHIHVIANSNDARAAVSAVSSDRGVLCESSGDARAGMLGLLRNPDVDVVVIQEILPNGLPEDVIGNIRKDPRMADAKIVVLAAKDEEAARERFGETVDGVVLGPLTGDSLRQAIDAALEGVPVEPRNARAEYFAAEASAALQTMAAGKAPIGGALGSLAAQLDRGDAVAVPAARALGLSGTEQQLDALLMAVNGAGSTELKVAAADAMGMILGRAQGCPQPIADGLAAVLASDAEVAVRTAAAAAFGKARIEDARKARVLQSLRKIGGATTSM